MFSQIIILAANLISLPHSSSPLGIGPPQAMAPVYGMVSQAVVMRQDDRFSRNPSNADAEVGDRYSVSVAQMRTPKRARAFFKRAVKALSKKKLNEALGFIEQALAAHASYAEAMTLRGELKMNADHPDDSLADLEKAVDFDCNYAPALIALGENYNLLERWSDAVRVLERGLTLDPGSWQGHYELGLSLLAKDDYRNALHHLTRTEEIEPGYAPVHLLRAKALFGVKRYPETRNELEAYLQWEPKGVHAEEARSSLEMVKALIPQEQK